MAEARACTEIANLPCGNLIFTQLGHDDGIMGRCSATGKKTARAVAVGIGLYLCSALAAGAASSAISEDNFICEVGGDEAPLAIVIDRNRGRGHFTGLGLKTTITAQENGRWGNEAAAVTFLPTDQPPMVIVGFREFPCIHAADNVATARSGGIAVDRPGQSLGGNMRTGPGVSHSRMKPLRGDTRLVILSNTRVSYRGYDWFRVKLADGRTGFQWGGILCSEGEAVEGLKRACRIAARAEADPEVTYQAFAIGPEGRFGHASSQDREEAEAAALSYCGAAQCNVQDVTTRKCHALANAAEVAFFGASKDSDDAAKRAFSACKKSGAKNCQVTYLVCR